MLIKDFKKAALIYQGREIFYAETISLVNRFASCYQLNKADRAAVFSENRPEWIYAYLSVWQKWRHLGAHRLSGPGRRGVLYPK